MSAAFLSPLGGLTTSAASAGEAAGRAIAGPQRFREQPDEFGRRLHPGVEKALPAEAGKRVSLIRQAGGDALEIVRPRRRPPHASRDCDESPAAGNPGERVKPGRPPGLRTG